MAKTPTKPADTAPAAPAVNAAPSIFDQAVAFVLRERIEGGYVNDPRDPGGETNFGISKRSYPRENIRALTRERAIQIYKRDYWDKPGCDKLPPKLAVALFDCAINQGAGIAPKLLQNALGVNADGTIGPVTAGAAAKADQDDAAIQFLGWRLRRYAFTANASTYMRGWSNRVLELQRFLLTELKEAA
ncbi:MAG: glycosyl hydrolase 108 family protein [Paracoccus sp. (in: a-proteobacteria)]|nr:glycosyl hydrolase 108 family protein [Paracoccus sp. (in: a-proteobacteria)]